LMPVAESAHVRLLLTSSCEGLVTVNAGHLRQAFFHLLGFALDSCAAGAEVRITAAEDEGATQVVVRRDCAAATGSCGGISVD